jgi:ATP/maltotriose-dependent transcriptional regulator MalT
VTWLDALEREHENLRQALHWLLEREEIELALRLAGALWWFWMVRGHLREGRQWLEKALAKSEGCTTSVRAKALSRMGMLAYAQGDFQQAEISYQQAFQLFQELGNKERAAVVLYRQGLVALMKGNHALATMLGEEALRTFKALNYKEGIPYTLLLLAYVASTQNEYDRARMLVEESLALFREAGDKWGMAYTLSHFAHIVFAQGNYAYAHTLVDESLALSKELDFRGGIASCLEVLAEIVAAQEQKTWAVRLWGAAEALREIIGGPQLSLERSSYEGMMATIRSELGEKVFAAAWAEGRAMTAEQVLSVQAQAPIPVKAPAESTPSASTPSSPTSIASLTARELEILRLLATGLTSAQIAEKLTISLLTVNTHVRSIYSKLGVTSRSAATRYAIERKIV